MKKILSIILVFVMIMSLSACQKSGSTKDSSATGSNTVAKTKSTADSKNIMFASIVTGGVAWGAAQKGFEDALKELGWKGQYSSPTSANDTAGVVTLLDTAVTNKADGIITVILDTNQATDVLTRAREAKIPVVTCNTFTNKKLQNCWIGTDPHNMGVAQAKAVLDNFDSSMGKNITACYIQTTLSTPTQNEQFKAFKETIKAKYPKAVFVQDECNSNAATAADKVAALRKSYPNLNAVVCADGYGCPGIANYIQSENLQDKMVAVGIDDSEEILGYVSSGALKVTIAQDFYKMGYNAVHYIKDIDDGKTPKFANDSGTITIGPDQVKEHLDLLKKRGLIK